MVKKLTLHFYMKLASKLLHPIFAPFYGTVGILWSSAEVTTNWPLSTKAYFLLFVLISYGLLPGMLAYMAYTLGWLSILRATQAERRILLLGTILIYTVSTYILPHIMPITGLPLQILWIATVLLALLWGFNFLLKVSLHAAGMASLVGIFGALLVKSMQEEFLWLALAALLCTGVVISSRLYLGVHRISEVCVGTLLGILLATVGILQFT